ncbi:GDP-L-fucose synthase [Desulfohalobiaceae bacterium Ax17]|uniref:GDP-L-fucose synthase family protein n=1 Tax=Desulfovulcanus ferrireducens TaxID=2831190 RepID=UPI00207BC291|nr:GDP-L-fucose synthase [Desulfovulcanus ferrireducens]MBT8763382.1 GDP-L-fucose synthase [Desulfovulcanus ferrireducens]
MHKNSKIYVAGHRGLVGSAIIRKLEEKGYSNIITRTHAELDLTRQDDVERFFEENRPEYVFLAAAKVGGIVANNTYKAEFIYDNLIIAANVINAAYKFGVKKLLNLGSSCIYPKFAPQPMKEEYLLTGSLEPTNEPYAIAKIAAIKLCRYYNEQYGTNFISVMPTNLYGPNDNFHLLNSHVLPALIRKFHLAKLLQQGDFEAIKRDFLKHRDGNIRTGSKSISLSLTSPTEDVLEVLKFYGITQNAISSTPSSSSSSIQHSTSNIQHPTSITLWGTGEVYREFLYVDDLADACIFLMKNYDYKEIGEFVNVGTGKDITISELAELVMSVVGFKGKLKFDSSKPDGTPRKLLDVSKLSDLGWRAKVPLKEGVKMTYDRYVRMGKK